MGKTSIAIVVTLVLAAVGAGTADAKKKDAIGAKLKGHVLRVRGETPTGRPVAGLGRPAGVGSVARCGVSSSCC